MLREYSTQSTYLATDGNVEDEVELIAIEGLAVGLVGIEGALLRPHHSVQWLLVVGLPVDQPNKLFGRPLQREDVKVVAKVEGDILLPTTEDVVRPLATVVNGAQHLSRIIATHLDNVNLPGGGPGAVLLVQREQPDCRPQVMARRHTRPNLVLAIAPSLTRVEPSRGELMSIEVLDTHLDHQVSVLHASVLIAQGRVTFEFVVALVETSN